MLHLEASLTLQTLLLVVEHHIQIAGAAELGRHPLQTSRDLTLWACPAPDAQPIEGAAKSTNSGARLPAFKSLPGRVAAVRSLSRHTLVPGANLKVNQTENQEESNSSVES